jgi:phosphohistidine phosphatase
MRTLWLLRHAKARAGERDQADHERELEERGLRDAERMGRRLAEEGFAPQWTLDEELQLVKTTKNVEWLIFD